VPIGSLPANLKIVSLSTQGSGTLVEDNSQAIGMKLFEAAGTRGSGSALPRAPQHGLPIGGNQSVRPLDAIDPTDAGAEGEAGTREHSGDDGCSIRPPGASAGAAWSLWLLLSAGAAALCREKRLSSLARPRARFDRRRVGGAQS
jgi:hypothetical protein